MHEHIILTPGLNGNELIKNLALHGVNCFNLRIVSAGEFARIALMRSGINVSEEFIDPNEQIVHIAKAVKDVEYFGKPSFVDIRNITAAVDQMRSLVAEQDEAAVLKDTLSKGIFIEKNNALLDVYERYMQILEDMDAIDSVMLIRKAIAKCSAITAEFSVLEEYPLNPLQNALIQKVSGGNVKTVCISSLFGASDKPLKISSYKNCYGASNEVETILADIYSGKNLDECTVAITDPATYGQLFFDYALLYDIPMTFGCGIPIMNSNPAKLLNLYYGWMTNGFYGSEAVNTMLNSNAFDKSKLRSVLPESGEGFSWSMFYEVLGQIRFTTEQKTNEERLKRFVRALAEDERHVDKDDAKAVKAILQKKLCIPFLEVMAKELALDTIDFITKYSYIRTGDSTSSKALLMRLDFSALNEIKEQMLLIKDVDLNMTKEDIILSVLRNNILVQQSEPGMLYISSLDRAVTSIRKYMYIAGLSAIRYPGSPKENYLLLDEDLRLFGTEAEKYTSSGRIESKKDCLIKLSKLASALGSDIKVSYAGLNVSELKGENASSLIYELFKEEHGSSVTSEQLNKSITKIDYFEPGISVGRFIGKEYVKGSFIVPRTHNREMRSLELTLEREYSPSALDSYADCPMKFFLMYVIGLKTPDEDDPFEIIPANDEGKLAHLLMEVLADDPNMSLEQFKKTAEEYFDRYIDEHVPLISKSVEHKKSQFIEMMENAYNTDPMPRREVVLKEEDIHCEHETGIKLHGFPDRVEKLDDGTCIIVDYKTGNTVKHVQDDPVTCLQVLVYAYLMEKKRYKISSCEYRYIRLGQTVTCKWDQETKTRLGEMLENFKHDMTHDYFRLNYITEDEANSSKNDPCRYCKFGSVCGKEALS